MTQTILCMWHADTPRSKGLVGPFKDNDEACDWFVDNKLGDMGAVYLTSEISAPLEALKSINDAIQEREDVGKS